MKASRFFTNSYPVYDEIDIVRQCARCGFSGFHSNDCLEPELQAQARLTEQLEASVKMLQEESNA